MGEDMFDRLISLIGRENVDKISKTNIAIVGIGGVGGFALEALVRCGIKNITIFDGDIIDISNLNRQIITNWENITLTLHIKEKVMCGRMIRGLS